MNRLRIVVEETGPDTFQVIYCGTDRAKGEAALHEPSRNRRALFVKPGVSQFNRPISAAAAAPVAAPVIKSESAEAPKSKKK